MKSRRILKLTFAAYCVLMLWLLFIRYRDVEVTDYWQQLGGRISLIPLSSTLSMLETLWHYQRPDVLWEVIYNLGGNIVMFVPLGFCLTALWPRFRKFQSCMSAVAMIMLTVELTQLLTLRGFFDVDDILLNLIGAAIGWLIRIKSER